MSLNFEVPEKKAFRVDVEWRGRSERILHQAEISAKSGFLLICSGILDFQLQLRRVFNFFFVSF